MSKKKLLLNLGCGDDYKDGYINIDVDPQHNPDLIHDVTTPLPYEAGLVAAITMQDVLEHLTLESAGKLLAECARVLKNNGQIRIRAPRVLTVVKKFLFQPDLMMLYLYGDTSQSGVWGSHKYGYTPQLLTELAAEHDLRIISAHKRDTNWIFVIEKDIYLAKPEIKIVGSGWYAKNLADFRELKKFKGQKIIACTNIWSYLSGTVYGFVAGYRVIWFLSKLPPKLFGKSFLRPLSRLVRLLIVKDKQGQKFAQDILKFSHLRILVVRR